MGLGDVNPPVQAWAALELFAIDGGRDLDFLSRIFDKLLINFTWWINLEDAGQNNVFEGGFLGLDTSARSTARTCRSTASLNNRTPPVGWPATPSPWPASPPSCNAAGDVPRWTWS
jgi:hypothetical protein